MLKRNILEALPNIETLFRVIAATSETRTLDGELFIQGILEYVLYC